MTVLAITQQEGGPELHFVPKPYQQEFIEAVFKLYETACSNKEMIAKDKFEYVIPDAVADIGAMSSDFFVIGAVAIDNNDEDAFGRLLGDPSLSEEERADLLEDWHETYSYHIYNSWHSDYYDDIATVLSYFHMSYVVSQSNPFNPLERWITLNNYPIVEVW